MRDNRLGAAQGFSLYGPSSLPAGWSRASRNGSLLARCKGAERTGHNFISLGCPAREALLTASS